MIIMASWTELAKTTSRCETGQQHSGVRAAGCISARECLRGRASGKTSRIIFCKCKKSSLENGLLTRNLTKPNYC